MADIKEILKSLTDKDKENLLRELSTESKKEAYNKNLEIIEKNKEYVGRCFKNGDEYFRIIDSRSSNEYHLECFTFKFPASIKDVPIMHRIFTPDLVFGHQEMDGFFIEDKGLLCNNLKINNKKVIESYTEITEEEFEENMDRFYEDLKKEVERVINNNKGKDYTKNVM